MLLKELRHSVKQKNPDTEKDIKIPARNKGQPSEATAPQAASPAEPPDQADGFHLGERSLPDAVRELEQRALGQALAKARHHRGNAAKLLGLTYHQFRALYRKHRDGL